MNRTEIVVQKKKGPLLGSCASLSPEYVCCGVQVIGTVSNCPYRCSYCVLQDYLNESALKVVKDTPAIMDEVRARMDMEPWRFFRIGTWELGDSLAVEPETGAAAELVEAFAHLPNALLELKTKSDQVETLLKLKHGGRTVIAWSLNPPSVIQREEAGTASLKRRLAALARVLDAGYLVSLHFDPMILFQGWEKEYEQLAEAVFKVAPADRITWISVGSLRHNPEMKNIIEERHPQSQLTLPEMIQGPDGKVRYLKATREKLYKHMVASIRRGVGPSPYMYLCMERWDLWEKVLGHSFSSPGHHDYALTRSLYERFPGLVHCKPEEGRYATIKY